MIFLRAVALVAAAALAGLAVNAARPSGVALAAFQAPAVCSPGEAPVAELLPAEASALCGQAGVVIADVRAAAVFAEGHVADAIHLPCDASGQVADSARIAHARTIVVYGQSTDDARPVAASLAQRNPAVRVAVIKGGFPAWNAAGLACASGL